MAEMTLTIQNEVGLHARPAAMFVQTANHFEADIQICCNERTANAKSILDVLTLGAAQGAVIEIKAEGNDANEALFALQNLVENNFKE